VPSDIDEYFSGRRLYGDDFTEAQLREWYDGEREGYAGSVLANQPQYRYHYHELNRFHFFGRIDIVPGSAAIGLGSAYGHEFEPIAARLGRITIIDPSDEFAANGSLHHIANVSGVVRELHRVLAKGGCLLVREPIVTQGDWRRPRGKLTKNERGIPYDIFRNIATDAGFRIEYSALFDFAPFTRLMADIGRPVFTSAVATRVDRGLAALFSFNKKYHRVGFLDKFGPASLAMILRKPAG
jgi:SAM-dependent methyltransferase